MLFKEQNINIISIAQIFYAVGGKTGEYIRYNTPLCSNELIYRLDGENYTYFNGQKFHICGGTAYFLPRGRHSQYDVDIATQSTSGSNATDASQSRRSRAICRQTAGSASCS